MESTEILKTMHDARRPADILFHKYRVSLSNVFDTMTADAKIRGDANYGEPIVPFITTFSNRNILKQA